MGGQTKINDITIDKAHMSLSILRMHFPEAFKLMSKYFVFGVVRNPYKRVISSYNEVFFKEFIAKMSAEQIKGWTQSHRHFILQKNMFYVGRKCYADLILKLEELEQAPAVLSVFSEQLSKVSEMWVKRKNERKKDGVDLRIENVLTKDSS